MPKAYSHDTPDPVKFTVSVSFEIAGMNDATIEALAEAIVKTFA